jgi:hypothetical protein
MVKNRFSFVHSLPLLYSVVSVWTNKHIIKSSEPSEHIHRGKIL